jgi:class 3 adenylate cyclase/ActR/RegA family two-component response regulator
MKRSYKVLVIEDDTEWINILKPLLVSEGCRVTVCRTTEEGEAALSRELFHFATIDLKLLYDSYKTLAASGEWGGWKILKLIKEKSLNSTMGTMVVTWYDEEEIEDLAIKQHGAVYFKSKKRFSAKDFIAQISDYLEKYHDVYFNEGIIENSQLPEVVGPLSETERLDASLRSTNGLKEYFTQKKKEGKETIIVFSDLVDSTRFKDEIGFEEGLLKTFNHNQIVSQILTSAGGKIVKTIGDCVMARFDVDKSNQGRICVNVLNSVIRVQEAFWDKNIGVTRSLQKYRTKIGVSMGVTGDLYGGDPIGLSVDIAARLTAMAKPEQILVSNEVIQVANLSQLDARILKSPGRTLEPSHLVSKPVLRKVKGVQSKIMICEMKWDGKERDIQTI